jgi:hypothetical protein
MAIGATEGGLRIGREDGGEGGRPTDGVSLELGGSVEFWRGLRNIRIYLHSWEALIVGVSSERGFVCGEKWRRPAKKLAYHEGT